MDRKNIESFYPLSPMQQGMLFHTLYEPDSGVYVELLTATWRGSVDMEAFRRTWQRVVDRHPALRTAFLWEGVKEPIQVVQRQAEVRVSEQDWRTLTREEQEERLEAYLREERKRGFDLAEAPLLRLALIRMADEEYELVWTHHHLLLDGWSIPLLLKEVFAFYDAYLRGEELQLPKPRPYRDYIVWLKRQDMEAAERYWREKMAGFTAPTPLVVDRSSGAPAEGGFTDVEVEVSEELTTALKRLTQRYGLTMNTLIQGVWALLLSRYSGNDDVVYGSTVSGRPADLPGANEIIGLFINTLPVRVQVPADAALSQWLQELQAQQVEMRRYEYTPLADIQSWSEVPPGAPLFESLLVFENIPLDDIVEGGKGLDVQNVKTESTTNFPLVFVVVPGRELSLRLQYDASRFDQETIERMMGHFQNLLAGVAAAPDQPLSRLPLLSAEERAEVLHAFPEPQPFPAERTLVEWFEAQVERTPQRVALTFVDERYTYRALNARANQLAHYLRRRGVGPETPVGLLLERSAETVIAILGALKAGGAYVPIDPVYPLERMAFMLADTKAPLLITQGSLMERAAELEIEALSLDDAWEEIQQEPEDNPAIALDPENLAYVIYTSGSTGRPKGVLIPHTNVVRLLTATEPWYHFDENDVWTLFHSYAFDFSVWEIWGALLYGGRLVVVPYLVSRSPESFYDLLLTEGVTVLNQTPSAFRQLIRAAAEAETPAETPLRWVIFGGEALELQSLRPWFDLFGDEKPQLVNMYGITETTVHVTYRPISRADVEAGAGSVIGRPIPDMTLYVLDRQGEPQPFGVPGELHVGGAGIARGYLDRPALSADRFVPDPFGGDPGARLYKAGDLARLLPDGDVEYLGRIDFQVKIRGFRVELGEIESVLVRHENVRESVVLVREDSPGDKRLVAYVTPVGNNDVDAGVLRVHCLRSLPDYMVPAAFVVLDAIPLNPNGKVDRRALPAPEWSREALKTEYIAPRTEGERQLAAIWSQVLGAKRVGILDNFFDLGGDSIMSIQVVGLARRKGLRLTPRRLFETPTIAALIAELDAATAPGDGEGQAEEEVLSARLTPIQEQFFSRYGDYPHQWNTSMLLEIHGGLRTDVLEEVVRGLMEAHGSLRLRFERVGDIWRQYEVRDETPPFVIMDLSAAAESERAQVIAARATELQQSLNIYDGPLFRVAYLDMGADAPARLLFVFHHLIMDGVSWRILLEDFQVMYRQADRGQKAEPLAEGTTFLSWAQRLRRYAQSAEVREEAPFWLEMADAPALTLPVDHPQGRNTFAVTEHVSISLEADSSHVLLSQIPAQSGLRVNDVLVTALLRVLKRESGLERMLLELERHGREDIFPDVDISRTTGWFTSAFPMTLRLQKSAGAREQVLSVREQLQAAPIGGIGYGLLRYLHEDEALHRQMQTIPDPQISFNYLGDFGRGQSAQEGERMQQPWAGRWQRILMQARKTLSHIAPQRIRVAEEEVGPEQHPDGERAAQLHIVSIVSADQLHVRWLYSRELHDRKTVERWANLYVQELANLVSQLVAGDN
ncbi:MAG TPA: amino acid adenylation domain-containing protein [Caldilineae bacterium]|nr:amino acid adenylation domain-containing protein [Caldilineae bacterium]